MNLASSLAAPLRVVCFVWVCDAAASHAAPDLRGADQCHALSLSFERAVGPAGIRTLNPLGKSQLLCC